MPQPLDDEALQGRLSEVPDWELSDGALRRQVVFRNFSEAFAFMVRVALVAEKLDHHPDWSNSWNRVSLAITSHAAGGVTDQCLSFARQVDDVLAGH